MATGSDKRKKPKKNLLGVLLSPQQEKAMTAQLRGSLKTLLMGDTDKLKEELNSLKGKDYVQCWAQLAQYSLPRLSMTHKTIEEESKTVITVSLEQSNPIDNDEESTEIRVRRNKKRDFDIDDSDIKDITPEEEED